MQNNTGTAVRVARTLSVLEYMSISMLVLALIARLTKLPDGGVFCMLGISLLVVTPLAGVITAGISAKSGRRKMLPYSIIIVVVYAIALVLAR